jgi:hypothetical protein
MSRRAFGRRDQRTQGQRLARRNHLAHSRTCIATIDLLPMPVHQRGVVGAPSIPRFASRCTTTAVNANHNLLMRAIGASTRSSRPNASAWTMRLDEATIIGQERSTPRTFQPSRATSRWAACTSRWNVWNARGSSHRGWASRRRNVEGGPKLTFASQPRDSGRQNAHARRSSICGRA